MNRRTYSLAALTLALAAGVMLAVSFSKVPVLAPAKGQSAGPGVAGGVEAGGSGTSAATGVAPGAATVSALPPEPGTHDPVLIKEGDYYYLFYTGGNVLSLRSKDLIHWESPVAVPATRGGTAATSAATSAATVAAGAGGGRGGRGGRGGTGGVRAVSALPGMPNSISEVLPNVGSLWAPDVSFYKGRYQIYYAASSFGSRNSAIGLATNKTLDPGSKDYAWHDEGVVVRTQQSDNYNAIDPNFVLDEKGEPWLDFGSFWSGIKLVKLGADGKVDPKEKMVSIAARKPPTTAIEAPFIIREGKYFYLFVSWDKCCAGLQSTYRVMVGRAEKITGPYVDKEGVDMAAGGGTQVLAGDGARIIGPGHEGLFKDGEKWLMVHHFYDGNTPNGASKLQVRPVTFDEKGWPVVGKAMNSPG